jgi:hypothetical protein
MAKKRFFPTKLEGKIIWLNNFVKTLPTYAAKYGIAATQLADLNKDRDWMNYWAEQRNLNNTYAQGLTAFRNEVAFGRLPTGTTASEAPAPPATGTPPPAVAPGVFPRCLAVANAIKVHINYTVADGEALGLEGAQIVKPGLNDARPVLKPVKSGEVVTIKWGKQKLPVDGLEIHVKRGAADFTFLATDTNTPSFIDTFPQPATPEEWTYKGIYIKDGVRVGLWSEAVAIVVKGV